MCSYYYTRGFFRKQEGKGPSVLIPWQLNIIQTVKLFLETFMFEYILCRRDGCHWWSPVLPMRICSHSLTPVKSSQGEHKKWSYGNKKWTTEVMFEIRFMELFAHCFLSTKPIRIHFLNSLLCLFGFCCFGECFCFVLVVVVVAP